MHVVSLFRIELGKIYLLLTLLWKGTYWWACLCVRRFFLRFSSARFLGSEPWITKSWVVFTYPSHEIAGNGNAIDISLPADGHSWSDSVRNRLTCIYFVWGYVTDGMFPSLSNTLLLHARSLFPRSKAFIISVLTWMFLFKISGRRRYFLTQLVILWTFKSCNFSCLRVSAFCLVKSLLLFTFFWIYVFFMKFFSRFFDICWNLNVFASWESLGLPESMKIIIKTAHLVLFRLRIQRALWHQLAFRWQHNRGTRLDGQTDGQAVAYRGWWREHL